MIKISKIIIITTTIHKIYFSEAIEKSNRTGSQDLLTQCLGESPKPYEKQAGFNHLDLRRNDMCIGTVSDKADLLGATR